MSNLCHLPSTGAEQEIGSDADDDILSQLGVCRLRVTLPSRWAHLEGPIPELLEEFADGRANWFDCIHSDDAQRVRDCLPRVARGEDRRPLEYRIESKRGGVLWIRHGWCRPNPADARSADEVECFIQLIDNRTQLAAEGLRATERARRQIGQELHDDVCQVLAGLACMLELFRLRVTAGIPELAPKLEEIIAELNEGMARTRMLAHGLIRAPLSVTELPVALQELATKISRNHGVAVTVRASPDLPALPPEQMLNLYRIAQEASANAVKHGRATKIELCLERRGAEMQLAIKDNGAGMPAENLRVNGVGLYSMRNRAVALGGECSFIASQDGGTVVNVSFSCPPFSSRDGRRLAS